MPGLGGLGSGGRAEGSLHQRMKLLKEVSKDRFLTPYPILQGGGGSCQLGKAGSRNQGTEGMS